MRKVLIAVIVLLAISDAIAENSGGQAYMEKSRFSAVFPSGWTKKEEVLGLSDAEKKVYSVEMLAPVSGDFPVKIGVHYYAPGNLLYKSHEKFIKLNAQSALGANLEGNVYGKVKDGLAGNCYARIFERKTLDYFPKQSMNPQKVYIYEKFAVVPVKTGFFVLRYYAPMDLAKANLKAYELVLASFKTLVR